MTRSARIEAERRQQVAEARAELGRARVAADIEGGAAAYRVLFAASREAGSHVRRQRSGDRRGHGRVPRRRSLTHRPLDSLRAAISARLAEIDLRGQALEAHRELEAALGRPLTGGGF